MSQAWRPIGNRCAFLRAGMWNAVAFGGRE